MPQSHSATLDGTCSSPGPTQTVTPLGRGVPARPRSQLPFPSPGDRWDRITATVLCLLFDMTQQVARFGAADDPWSQLAVYDVDGFAAFLTEGVA